MGNAKVMLKWIKLAPTLIWVFILIGGAIAWSIIKSFFVNPAAASVKKRASADRDKLRQAIKAGDTKALRKEAVAWAREKK